MKYVSNLIQKIKEIEYKTVIPWIWLLFGIGWSIAYQLVWGQAMLDSDMASEMVVANILNQEHSIIGITKNWLYSTELGFFSMEWILRIGLMVSPHNWHLARTISMTIGIVLLAYSTWLAFYAIKLPDLGLWVAAFTVLPGGGWYFWQTIYGGLNLSYIIIMMFEFAFTAMASGGVKNKRRIVLLFLVIIIGIASGMRGIRLIMLYYFPLIIASVIVIYIDIVGQKKKGEFIWRDFIKGKNCCFFITAMASAIASIAGYLFNSMVLSKIYSYSHFGETKISGGSFLNQLRNYIWNFGYVDGKVVMSFRGVASISGVIFGVLVILSGIILCGRVAKLDIEQQWLVSLSIVSIALCIFVFSYVDHGEINYYQPIIPFGYVLLLFAIYTGDYVFSEGRFAIKNIVIAVLVFISVGTVCNETDGAIHVYRAKGAELNDLVTWLRGGYSKGVSRFWTSNIVTELSDGDIEMWIMDSYDSHTLYPHLQKTDHLDSFPNDEYFFLAEKKDGEDGEYMKEYVRVFLEAHPELHEIYQDEKYIVYGTL